MFKMLQCVHSTHIHSNVLFYCCYIKTHIQIICQYHLFPHFEHPCNVKSMYNGTYISVVSCLTIERIYQPLGTESVRHCPVWGVHQPTPVAMTLLVMTQ